MHNSQFIMYIMMRYVCTQYYNAQFIMYDL